MAEAYRLAKEKMEQAKAGGAGSGSDEEPVERPREPACRACWLASAWPCLPVRLAWLQRCIY